MNRHSGVWPAGHCLENPAMEEKVLTPPQELKDVNKYHCIKWWVPGSGRGELAKLRSTEELILAGATAHALSWQESAVVSNLEPDGVSETCVARGQCSQMGWKDEFHSVWMCLHCLVPSPCLPQSLSRSRGSKDVRPRRMKDRRGLEQKGTWSFVFIKYKEKRKPRGLCHRNIRTRPLRICHHGQFPHPLWVSKAPFSWTSNSKGVAYLRALSRVLNSVWFQKLPGTRPGT